MNFDDITTSLVTTSSKVAKKTDDEILQAGAVSFEDFFDNFQYLAFVLDGSGSMFSKIQDADTCTKVELEKRVIRKYVDQKIGANSIGMKIGIVEFDDKVRTHLEGSSDLDAIRAAVNLIGQMGGGTNASNGLTRAMSFLKKTRRGQDVVVPRIILTSDGQMQDIYRVEETIRAAKAAGIVIDTIYIGPMDGYNLQYSEELRRISDKTGGVHEMITSEAEFEQKFLKVAARQIAAKSVTS